MQSYYFFLILANIPLFSSLPSAAFLLFISHLLSLISYLLSLISYLSTYQLLVIS